MEERPALTPGMPPALFAEHYWLRSELTDFCRSAGLPTQGAKTALAARILAFLNGQRLQEAPVRRRSAEMPASFTRSSVIGAGWRCSQPLRTWFEHELGEPFRFDAILRESIHSGVGRTLGEILDDWLAKRASRSVTSIAPQFEYNRFVREYRAAAPAARHDEMVAAWRRYRNTPASERPSVSSLACGPPSHL